MLEGLVIADASPLIALVAIGELDMWESLYGRIYVTPVVRGEIQHDLPDWIIVSDGYDRDKEELLAIQLDRGEASAIALALMHPDHRLIIDEKKGRKIAKQLGVKVVGLLGIIVKCKDSGLIESGTEILDKLAGHGFWLAPKLRQQVVEKLGE